VISRVAWAGFSEASAVADLEACLAAGSVSWWKTSPIAPHQLEQAIGPEALAALTQQTGLSREEILSRLSTTLPEAVDKFTPDGRLPDATDLPRS
jgi:uncharacterized protein YidB (DUF937 family)